MGIRGWGPDESAAICEAVAALFELMRGAEMPEPDTMLDLKIEAESLEDLLVELLNELISLADLSETVFVRIVRESLEFDEGKFRMKVAVSGKTGARDGDRPGSEIKAAVRYGATVSRGQSGLWTASCVVDV